MMRAFALCVIGCALLVSAHYHSDELTCEDSEEVCNVHAPIREEQLALNAELVAEHRKRRTLLTPRGRRTGVIEYSDREGGYTHKAYGGYFHEDVAKLKGGVLTHPLSFHVLMNSASCKSSDCGYVSRKSIYAQVAHLNKAFSGDTNPTGFSSVTKAQGSTDTKVRFKLHSITYYDNEDFWSKCWNSKGGTLNTMRSYFSIDPSIVTNVWTCNAPVSIGFIVNYPWESGADNVRNGIGLWSPVVTGSGHEYYTEGDIMVHEMGHHLGVAHPYDGACIKDSESAVSDGIADTPRMKSNIRPTCASYGKNHDSCPDLSPGLNGGKDLLDNYMVASEDACRWHFTPGQVEFMQAMMARYRESYFQNKDPGCVTAMTDEDSVPDTQPCWFGDWYASYPHKPPGSMTYQGKTYTKAGGPITDKAPPGFSGTWTDSRGWCFTDHTMTKWGYACCAHSRDEDCLKPSSASAGPGPSPTPEPEAESEAEGTPTPTKTPTKAPTKTPTTSAPVPLPKLECLVDGGPLKRRNKRGPFSKCQFPFVYDGTTYTTCLSVQNNPPRYMKKIEGPKDSATRDGLWCPWKVHPRTRAYGYGRRGRGFQRNWGFCNCNYWPNDPKGHHYDSRAQSTIPDGVCDGAPCSSCSTRSKCEQHCDKIDSCKAYVYDEANDNCKIRTCAADSDIRPQSGSTLAIKGREVVHMNMLSSGTGHDAIEIYGEEDSADVEDYEEYYYYDETTGERLQGKVPQGKSSSEGGIGATAAAVGGSVAALFVLGAAGFVVRRHLVSGSLGHKMDDDGEQFDGHVKPGSGKLPVSEPPQDSSALQGAVTEI